MSKIQMFLNELESEAKTTRAMLERVPDDKYDWKPHEKSMTIRQLATHIAELPTWIPITLDTDELDFSKNPYNPVAINNTRELLEYFEKSLVEGRAALSKASDDHSDLPWTLRSGETIYSTSSKGEVLRMAISQIIHHRAQLGVYLRLLNIPIPGSYGPSADEMSS